MSRQHGNPERPYWVEAWYGPGGRKGTRKNPNRGRVGERAGDLCIATEHTTESSRDMELAVLAARRDIDAISHGYNDGQGIR